MVSLSAEETLCCLLSEVSFFDTFLEERKLIEPEFFFIIISNLSYIKWHIKCQMICQISYNISIFN